MEVPGSSEARSFFSCVQCYGFVFVGYVLSLHFISTYLFLNYFFKFMCLKRKGALFFLWRNVFPDAPGLGLFVVLSPEVRRAVCAFNSGLLHKKCLYWELWPSSCASKLDFPLHGITPSVLLKEIGQPCEKSIRFDKRMGMSQVSTEKLCEHRNL